MRLGGLGVNANAECDERLEERSEKGPVTGHHGDGPPRSAWL
jgi:hypothetical protein